MNRTGKHCALGMMTLGLSLSSGVAKSLDRPNILLITTDDQGLQAGCYGDPLARTPNIDRLASEGMRFTRGYVTQSSCSPSRSTMLTGKYPHQNGHFGLTNNFRIHDGIKTLPAIMNDAGYRTGIIGKLHVNPPEAFPFQFMEVNSPIQTRHVRAVNAAAQKFMDMEADKPFFLMVNYFDPHSPYDDLANQCDGLPEKPYGLEEIRPFDFMGVDVPELRKEVAVYYNCVSRADTGIGMLLESLEERGLKENTLVIFLSDNGPPFTRGKATCYEAGLHVPFIVRFPQADCAGQTCDELVSTVDIFPTILDVSGISGAEKLPGESLLPLLAGKTKGARKSLFGEFTAHGIEHYYPRRSVCNQQYKLIHNLMPERQNPWTGINIVRAMGEDKPLRGPAGHYNATLPAFYDDPAHSFGAPPEVIRQSFVTFLNPPEFELYDLEKDPYERTNLSESPEYSEILKHLQARLNDWRETESDPFRDPDYIKEFTHQADVMRRKRQLRVPFVLY